MSDNRQGGNPSGSSDRPKGRRSRKRGNKGGASSAGGNANTTSGANPGGGGKNRGGGGGGGGGGRRRASQNNNNTNRRGRSRRQKQQDTTSFWGDPTALPQPKTDVRITDDADAVPRSLGTPPLPGQEAIAGHYFAAVYDRAVATAGALAAAGGLIDPNALTDDD